MNLEEIYIRVKTNYENNSKNILNSITLLESKLDKAENEKAKEIIKNQIIRKKNYLKNIKNIISYLRVPSFEDIEYRKNIMNNYSKEIESAVPDNLHLCFHGCPIYTAKEIIDSKQISSSVDRIGVETSYDLSNQVSVTTKDTFITTLDGYSDIHSLNYTIPCGVIFVILPNGEEEIKSSKSMLIGNVDLTDDNRLYAIISTPENIERLKEWCDNSNINSNKVYSFDSFLDRLNNTKTH